MLSEEDEEKGKILFLSFTFDYYRAMELVTDVRHIPDADFEWIDPEGKFISNTQRTRREFQIYADLIDNRIAVVVFFIEVE